MKKLIYYYVFIGILQVHPIFSCSQPSEALLEKALMEKARLEKALAEETQVKNALLEKAQIEKARLEKALIEKARWEKCLVDALELKKEIPDFDKSIETILRGYFNAYGCKDWSEMKRSHGPDRLVHYYELACQEVVRQYWLSKTRQQAAPGLRFYTD